MMLDRIAGEDRRSWSLRCFGGFELVDPDGTVCTIQSRKSRLILVALAAEPHHKLTRSQLAGLLWEAEDTKARQSLRQELSALRKALGRHAQAILAISPEEVALVSAGVETDIALLDKAQPESLSCEELERLAGDYRGDLAANVEIIGAPEQQAWLEAMRSFYRNKAIGLLDELVRRHSAAGRHAAALKWADALHTIDPLREVTHRHVLGAEVAVNGRAAAMARYEQFRRLLRDELAVRPEPETQRLLERLRDTGSDPASGQPADAPLPVVSEARGTQAERLLGPQRQNRLSWLGLLLLAAVGALGFMSQYRSSGVGTFAGEGDGAISVGILPQGVIDGNEALSDMAQALRERLIRTFAHTPGFAPSRVDAAPPRNTGRDAQVRYLIDVSYAQVPDGRRAFMRIWDARSGLAIFNEPVTVPERKEEITRTQLNRRILTLAVRAMQIHRAESLREEEVSTPLGKLAIANALKQKARFAPSDHRERALYQAVLDKSPDNLLALLGLRHSLTRDLLQGEADNPAEAMKNLGDVIARLRTRSERLPDLHHARGIYALLACNLVEARAEFEQTLAMSPSFFGAKIGLQVIEALEGRADQALGRLEQMVEARNIHPHTSENAAIIGHVAIMAGEAGKAAEWFALAARANAAVALNQVRLAAALNRLGDHRAASEALARARALKMRPAHKWLPVEPVDDPRQSESTMRLRAFYTEIKALLDQKNTTASAQ